MPLDPIEGTLRLLDGGRRGVADARGPRVVGLCHAGDLFARYVRDPDAARAHLDAIADADFHGVRTWTVLVGNYWRDRTGEVSPQHTTNYWPLLSLFAAELKLRELRWLVSQGDLCRWRTSDGDRIAFMTQLADTLAPFGPLVIGVDGGNETWQNGEDDAARLAHLVQPFVDRLPCALVSLTSPQAEEGMPQYARLPATVTDVHSSRSAWPTPARRMFNARYENPNPDQPLIVYSEPGGPGPHVSAREHPEEWTPQAMAVLAAVSAMGGVYVYMSSPGVISDEPFRRYPSFRQTMSLLSALPDALGTYTRFHGGEGRSFSADRILGAVDEVRCDHATNGDVYVIAVYGPSGRYRLPIINGFEGTLYAGAPDGLAQAGITFRRDDGTLDVELDQGFVLIGWRR